MANTCAALLTSYPELWLAATEHPFLDQSADGSITPQQFNTWLIQDYHFVLDFTRLVAGCLMAAPPQDFDVLFDGLTALKDELNWFREKAAERGLDLATPRQGTCVTYCDMMLGLVDQPYAVQATVLWAIERAYNEAWQKPGQMVAPYGEFADRWGNAGFSEYVVLLANQTDRALAAAADEATQTAAKDAFVRVAELEKDFWQMAYAAS